MTKRKKKRSLSPKRMQRGLIVGASWYTPEQWERLKLLADDAEALDDTHNDWLQNATNHVRRLEQQGFLVVKVPIDADEWVAWCKKNGQALNGAARSEFTSQKVLEKFEASSPPGEFVSRHIKPQPNPIPVLDTLETLFEAERDTTIPPPYPFDRNLNTIRLPRKIEAHLQQLARAGNKIEAVKQVTQLTGAGLRVAKDYVDSLIP